MCSCKAWLPPICMKLCDVNYTHEHTHKHTHTHTYIYIFIRVLTYWHSETFRFLFVWCNTFIILNQQWQADDVLASRERVVFMGLVVDWREKKGGINWLLGDRLSGTVATWAVREITRCSSAFSATNISSNIVWLLQLHDRIQMKSNYA